MGAFKLVQTWNPVPGRKQEYAAFIAHEFKPLMKVLGLEVFLGWYTLVGGEPRVLFESMAESQNCLENALNNKWFHEMLDRFMNLVTDYASRVLKPAGWITLYHWRVPSLHEVKYVQAWDLLPGQQERYECFLREVHLPEMEAIGLGVTAGWQLKLGSGRQVLSEALASSLDALTKALGDERYLRLITKINELVAHYESRVMIRHRNFLDMLDNIYGRAIRAVPPDAMHSMVEPIEE